jgi:hypothetical protein
MLMDSTDIAVISKIDVGGHFQILLQHENRQHNGSTVAVVFLWSFMKKHILLPQYISISH